MSGRRSRSRRRRWRLASDRPSLLLLSVVRSSKDSLRAYTILSGAVLVRVIAAEKDISLIAVDNLGEPANRLASGGIAEVLLVNGRRVAPAEDVVASLTAEGDSLVKSIPDVLVLSGIA